MENSRFKFQVFQFVYLSLEVTEVWFTDLTFSILDRSDTRLLGRFPTSCPPALRNSFFFFTFEFLVLVFVRG